MGPICAANNSTPVSEIVGGSYLSDTSVVAAHVVLPAGAVAWLPPLDGAWTGFGPGEALPDTLRTTRTGGEAAVYDMFLESLRSVGSHSTSIPPHARPSPPWHALPGGLRYAGDVRTTGEGSWGDDQHVVDLAHQAHMLQTGYVDSQLVRFLDLIRDTSWYENALVMVMADHGIAFTAGTLIRDGIDENIDEVAFVPLFVKTPGQRAGRIDDRPAMLFDIMPTIADVLEVESPWAMEGVSLLDANPDASRRRVFGGVVEDIELPPNPVMDDAIARKADLFGSGTGWDTVYSFGPYRDLAGLPVDPLARARESAEIELVDASLYDQVDASTGVVPALVRASLRSDNVDADTWLAVAINGTYRDNSGVHDWTPQVAEFNAIVPPTSFVTGENEIEFYRIEETDGGPVLHHLEDD